MKDESTWGYEQAFLKQGYDFVIGIDEAGRGPLAGPVVACAAALRGESSPVRSTGHPLPITGEEDKENFKLIRDSKTLSEKQREGLYDFILENFYVGVGICDHKTIDRMNILEATFLSMRIAVSDLMKKISNSPSSSNSPNKISNNKNQITNEFQISNSKFQTNTCIVLVDGNKIIPNLSIEQRAIIGGDKLVKSISAASIAAKVARDRMMREAHMRYPEYDFAKHKGYGTAAHMAALKKYGPCEIHRRSFAPVKA